MLGGIRLRPKHSKSSYRDDDGMLPAPASFRSTKSAKRNLLGLVVVVLVLVWFFDPLSLFARTSTVSHYSPPHSPGAKQLVASNSKYIYPPIEHAPTLKELGIAKLFKETRARDKYVPEVEKTVFQSLNVDDDPDPAKQKAKEENDNLISITARAINAFKNQEKVVYRPKSNKNYPKVIIVTAVDFDKFSLDYLAKIVQNRVNYAHQQNYGVYVRWYQEFVPVMNSIQFINVEERARWVRLYCLRAAMFAFPEAEWFWYLDQDALVANTNVDVVDYLLNDEKISAAALRELSVIPPNGLIKTYKNLQSENVRFIFTQSDTKIETNSFMVKNDVIGRAMIDFWGDQLFLGYNNFPHGPDSALTHILQWHPFLLSKTVIVPARMINSLHPPQPISEDAKATDHIHHFKGDVVVQWSNAKTPKEAEQILAKYVTVDTKQKNSNVEKEQQAKQQNKQDPASKPVKEKGKQL